MNEFQRGSASVTAEVDVSADDFWKLLRDWPAVLNRDIDMIQTNKNAFIILFDSPLEAVTQRENFPGFKRT